MNSVVKSGSGFIAILTAALMAVGMATAEPINAFSLINGLVIIAGTFMSGWINLKEDRNDD